MLFHIVNNNRLNKIINFIASYQCLTLYPNSPPGVKATNRFATEGEVLFRNRALQGSSDSNTTRYITHGISSNRWKIVTVYIRLIFLRSVIANLTFPQIRIIRLKRNERVASAMSLLSCVKFSIVCLVFGRGPLRSYPW